MLENVLQVVLVVMGISVSICVYRTVVGPTMADRIVALDTLGINLAGFIALLMVVQRTGSYADPMLVVAILGFIGSIALSKFLERGTIFDRDNH